MDMRQKDTSVPQEVQRAKVQRAICFMVGALSGGVLFVLLYIVLMEYAPDYKTSFLQRYGYGFVVVPIVSGYLSMFLGPLCFGQNSTC